jgi:hypothetical protein
MLMACLSLIVLCVVALAYPKATLAPIPVKLKRF